MPSCGAAARVCVRGRKSLWAARRPGNQFFVCLSRHCALLQNKNGGGGRGRGGRGGGIRLDDIMNCRIGRSPAWAALYQSGAHFLSDLRLTRGWSNDTKARQTKRSTAIIRHLALRAATAHAMRAFCEIRSFMRKPSKPSSGKINEMHKRRQEEGKKNTHTHTRTWSQNNLVFELTSRGQLALPRTDKNKGAADCLRRRLLPARGQKPLGLLFSLPPSLSLPFSLPARQQQRKKKTSPNSVQTL